MMTKPAKRTHQTEIYQRQRRQSYAVLMIILIAIVVSISTRDSQFAIAKGATMGSMVAYLAQCAFTYIAYRTTGARHARQIMLNMYLGQMVKWLITVLGLAFTFIALPTVNTVAVIVGYLSMLLVHAVVMYRTNL